MTWERTPSGWLLELGNGYVHWNAPPCPSLWIGWMGAHPWNVCVLVNWGENA